MKKNPAAPAKRAPAKRTGRPPKEAKLERLVAYVDPKVLARAKKVAREEGFSSVSTWAAWVLTAASKPEGGKAIADVPSLRPGKIPRDLYEKPLPLDRGLMKALMQERGR